MKEEPPKAKASWLPYPCDNQNFETKGCQVRVHRTADGEQQQGAGAPGLRCEREEAGIRVVEDAGKRLVLLRLPPQPSREVRALLSLCGFIFDLPEMAWTRRLDKRGLAAADKVLRRIAEMT